MFNEPWFGWGLVSYGACLILETVISSVFMEFRLVLLCFKGVVVNFGKLGSPNQIECHTEIGPKTIWVWIVQGKYIVEMWDLFSLLTKRSLNNKRKHTTRICMHVRENLGPTSLVEGGHLAHVLLLNQNYNLSISLLSLMNTWSFTRRIW